MGIYRNSYGSPHIVTKISSLASTRLRPPGPKIYNLDSDLCGCEVRARNPVRALGAGARFRPEATLKAFGSFPIGGPHYRPQDILILIQGTPHMVLLILGNPPFKYFGRK